MIYGGDCCMTLLIQCQCPSTLPFFRVEQSYNIHTVLYLRSGARVWESSLSQGHHKAVLVRGRAGAGVPFP